MRRTRRRPTAAGEQAVVEGAPSGPKWRAGAANRDHLIHRDNTFGTPEEDAFRRDFTVNALFYDIATFSVIDYVGGIDDLHARVIRCIGDPDVRFREDPVRMLRAIVLAARLEFTVDPPVVDAIRRNAPEIARSAAARLVEEFYKILRSGAAERAFRELADIGLLHWIAPELEGIAGRRLVGVARGTRSVPPPLRDGARVDDQSRAARHAAGAARLHGPPAVPRRARRRAARNRAGRR